MTKMEARLSRDRFHEQVDAFTFQISEMLCEVENVYLLGWSGRRELARISESIRKLQSFVRKKKAMDGEMHKFLPEERELERHFKLIEIEFELIDNLLGNDCKLKDMDIR